MVTDCHSSGIFCSHHNRNDSDSISDVDFQSEALDESMIKSFLTQFRHDVTSFELRNSSDLPTSPLVPPQRVDGEDFLLPTISPPPSISLPLPSIPEQVLSFKEVKTERKEIGLYMNLIFLKGHTNWKAIEIYPI